VVLFLFLGHLGVGIVLTLVFVSREAGVKFFRFNAGLAAVLIGIALALRPPAPAPASVAALLALILAEVAIVAYWATVGRGFASIRPILVAVGVGGGAAAIVMQAVAVSVGWPLPMRALTIASVLSSAVLLGGTCTAMILGHWYLIIPSMQVSHLQALVKLHIASLVVRIAVVAAVVISGIAMWQPGLGPNFRAYITSIAGGVFFWQRVLFGLAGPAFLSYLTWETAKIRSTQSATGILYVDFFMVVVGEVLAKYLMLATRVPV
jgi:protein NrfD